MALLNNDKDVLPLSSISELLNAKIRTLKMYEDKKLFPLKNNKLKKLYSINDIKIIAFVHYLANIKKINANGISYILTMIENNMDVTPYYFSEQLQEFVIDESKQGLIVKA